MMLALIVGWAGAVTITLHLLRKDTLTVKRLLVIHYSWATLVMILFLIINWRHIGDIAP